MRGIKEISGLCFWLNNEREELVKQVLANQRHTPRSKQALLKDLEQEGKKPSLPRHPPDTRHWESRA